MRTRAALLWRTGQHWSVEAIELDAPRSGEDLRDGATILGIVVW